MPRAHDPRAPPESERSRPKTISADPSPPAEAIFGKVSNENCPKSRGALQEVGSVPCGGTKRKCPPVEWRARCNYDPHSIGSNLAPHSGHLSVLSSK